MLSQVQSPYSLRTLMPKKENRKEGELGEKDTKEGGKGHFPDLFVWKLKPEPML